MAPLELWLFLPSAIIVPFIIGICYVMRSYLSAYGTIWLAGLLVTAGMCVFESVASLNYCLSYESRPKPMNPGGFSISSYGMFAYLSFTSFLVIPSFPLLAFLGCIPPRHYSLTRRVMVSVLCIAAALACTFVVVRSHSWCSAQRKRDNPYISNPAKESRSYTVNKDGVVVFGTP